LQGAITQLSLVRSPILRLLDEAGFHAHHAEQTIGALQADTVLAEALDIEPRAALLRISRTVYDAKDRPFLITHAHYRSDRFNIRMDLKLPRPA
jgi:GntR family transcriptional regulator